MFFVPLIVASNQYDDAASNASLASIEKTCLLAWFILGITAIDAIKIIIAKTTITASNSIKVKPLTFLIFFFINRLLSTLK